MYGGRASVTSQPPLSAASCSNLLCLFLIFFVLLVFYKLLLNNPPWGRRRIVIEAKRKEKLLEPGAQWVSSRVEWCQETEKRKRKTPRRKLPDVFMEGDSPTPLPNNISPLPLPHHLPLTPSTLLRTDKVKLNFRLYFIYLLFILFVQDFMHFHCFCIRLYSWSTVIKV
jgi:hypothetical protein